MSARDGVDVVIDVVVVGGGPAGLAAAIACARAGLRVTLLERRMPPIDKACGEGLMPSAVHALGTLGVDIAALGGRPIRGIAWRDGAREVRGKFRSGTALGVRRTRLYAALVDAARAVGAELRFGVRVRALLPDGVLTEDGVIRARFVVGADGLHSRVRAWAGLAARRGARTRFGVRRHVAVAPWSNDVEITWTRGAEAYVTPVGAHEVGIALLVDGGARGAWSSRRGPPGDGRPMVASSIGARASAAGRAEDDAFEALLEELFPALARRVAGARRTSARRGAGPFRTIVPRLVTEREATRADAAAVALVGDASGYVDPITGEGLGLAFRQALALGPALARDDLEAYARASRRITAPHERMTTALLALQRRPAARSAFLALLARAPRLFDRLLDIQGGGPSARGLPARTGVRRPRAGRCERPRAG